MEMLVVTITAEVTLNYANLLVGWLTDNVVFVHAVYRRSGFQTFYAKSIWCEVVVDASFSPLVFFFKKYEI